MATEPLDEGFTLAIGQEQPVGLARQAGVVIAGVGQIAATRAPDRGEGRPVTLLYDIPRLRRRVMPLMGAPACRARVDTELVPHRSA